MPISNGPEFRGKAVAGAFAFVLLLATHHSAAAAPAATPAPAAPAEIRLWPGVAPGSEGKTSPEVVTNTDGTHRVSSIHKPSIIPYLPSKDATGAAVIVLPGGGHKYLAIDNEGHKVAQWFADHGIAAFVLKYRLAREEGSTYKVEVHALQDAQRALRLVRSRAKTWHLDPQRIGVMGFSAGGALVNLAAARFDAGKADAADPIEHESSRPAFQVLMYAGGAADTEVPKDAPPAFFCAAADDKGPAGGSLSRFAKLREAGVSAELHIFANGGHGFGMKDRPLPVTAWPSRVREWLDDQGFLKTQVAAAAATTNAR
jgi:acetyl esterase/lipase